MPPGLGRYTVLRRIAGGGMADIYLGTQHGAAGFQRQVVIKAIHPECSADPHFRNMLVDEAHIAMSLTHSNIVQVLDLGVASGRYFLILELVDGWDLDALLKRAASARMPLPPELALFVTAEVCRALAYAHGKKRGGAPLGIVHRDVSPQNVLVSEQGEVKLTDFGIATAADRRERTVTGLVKGKVGFMSPEQASGGELDGRSDLFSLGSVLYVLVTGKRPFAADTELETLLRTKEAHFPPPEEARPGLHPDLCALLGKAMARERERRFANAEEMLLEVERVQRTAFQPVGPTELKRYLAELGGRDKEQPVGRLSAPPIKIADDDIISAEPGALVLSNVEPREVTPAPTARPTPPPPPAPTPASAGRWLLALLAAVAVGGVALFALRPPPPEPARPAPAPPEPQAEARPVLDPDPAQEPEAVVDAGAVLAAIVPAPDAALWAPEAVDAGPALAPDAGAPAEVDAGAAQPEVADAGPAEAEPEPEPDAGPVAARPARPAPEPAEGEASAPSVSVSFTSAPPGAAVRVEHKTFGVTPVSVRFRPGLAYEVVFELAGYEAATRKVYVTKRANQAVQVSLKPQK